MKKSYILVYILCFEFTLYAQQPYSVPGPGYFPIAVWLQSPSNAMAYKNAGVNMFIGLWNPLDQTQLSALTNAKMRVMCEQNAFGLTKLSDTLIYGWTLGDEPDNAQWNATTQSYDPCIDPAVIISQYNSVKANDPSRPVYLNLGQGVSYTSWVGRGTCTGKTEMYPDYNNGYLKGCDIGSFDIYPVNNSDATTSGKLWYVPKGIDSLCKWTSYNKPVFCWIECTKIDANSAAKPTTSQVKSEVWMALIHGAKGFGYFCHSWTPSFAEAALLNDAPMLTAVTAINTEITSLAPVLNSSTTKGYAMVSSTNTAVPIDFMTKNYGGANYIFSVAMRPGTTSATFTVTSGTSVEVIGESRNIPIVGGKFTDSFTDYGVHLYKITSSTAIQDPAGHTAGVRVYPNPFSDAVTFELDHSFSLPFELELFDISGRKVIEFNSVQDHKFSVSVSELIRGTYFYSIKSYKSNYNLNGKIIVSR